MWKSEGIRQAPDSYPLSRGPDGGEDLRNVRVASAPDATAWFIGRAALVLLGGAILCALLLVGNISLCPFALVTGQPCPSCGITRATRALLNGDWAESRRLHPLVLPVVPTIVSWAILGSWHYVFEGRFRSFEANRSGAATFFTIGLGALAIIFWLMRFFGYFGGPVSIGLR